MTTRSILFGCLGPIFLLGGCIFEDPLPPPSATDSTGATTTTLPTTGGSATSMSGPMTSMSTLGPTTTDPSTVGSLDTTADSTTSEVSATVGSSSTGPVDPCDATCTVIACGVQDMCDCGVCPNMEATCSEDQTYCGLPVGAYSPLPFMASIPAEFQLGYRYTIFQPRTVRRLGINTWGAGTDVRLALYDDDGLGPHNRLVQTGVVTLYANGINEWEVGATDIMPGDYWVMLHTGGATPIRRGLNGELNYTRALRSSIPFAAGFPPVMDDEVIELDYQYNIYMIVED